MMHFVTELHGYSASITAARYLGWPNLSAGNRVLWNSSWSNIDQSTRPPQEIFKLLMTTPPYNVKGGSSYNFDPAYKK